MAMSIRMNFAGGATYEEAALMPARIERSVRAGIKKPSALKE